MNILFVIGIAVNVIGDIMLGAYAIKYNLAFKKAARMPMRMTELKAQWLSKRKWAFGMIIGGIIISYLASMTG